MRYPKNLNLWLQPYLIDRIHSLGRPRAKRLWVAITDHYEPLGGKVSQQVGLQRVKVWQDRWPVIAASAPLDTEGRSPCMTFFYPQEEYNYDILCQLADLCQSGIADVEVHIHHDHDTADAFQAKLETFLMRLHQDHGLLRYHNGHLAFGFIHGNWALDNSRPDGRWCGVRGELQLLSAMGCYADFTMPSLPSATQSRILNKIYWTNGNPERPRGFDQGIEASIGGGTRGDLLMITGPTGLRYRGRLLPRIETGELAAYDLPTPYRVQRWLDLAPRIGDDIFLKLYAHGAREDNAAALLGSAKEPGALAEMFQWISHAAEAQHLELRWVSAYDMFRAVDSLMTPVVSEVQS